MACPSHFYCLLYLAVSLASLSAQKSAAPGPNPSASTTLRLPLDSVFVGNEKFNQVVEKALREGWQRLPFGERVGRVGRELVGTPYRSYTLEIDDRIESPSVNLRGLDCWTFFETSLGLARMLERPQTAYTPYDLLREIETTRYRGGTCGGNYLERLHYLAEWYVDNDKRGTIVDLTRRLGGVPFEDRRCTEMSTLWRSYRYLKKNPDLRQGMAVQERRVSALPVRYIPREKVESIEPYLQTGDVIGIATRNQGVFCSHVGLALRASDGSVRLMHASSDPKKVIIDVPIHEYLYRYGKNLGILVGRPQAPSRAAMGSARGERSRR